MQKKWKQASGLILNDIKLRQIGHFSSGFLPKYLQLLPKFIINEKNMFYLLGTIGVGFGIS